MGNNITWGKMKSIFEKCNDDTPVTLEFLNSFPDFEKNYRKEVEETNTQWRKAYTASLKQQFYSEFHENFDPIKMTGMVDSLRTIYPQVIMLSEELFKQGYILEEAYSHEWEGKDLNDMVILHNELTRLNNQMKFIIEKGLDNGK